ncbi:MAG: adenylate/guanylate cyclase domain-containing protein [Myxococcales bacterium]|nr:adenylate/guanylate cyclase domain-containing protein [Myxococcales bacterium]
MSDNALVAGPPSLRAFLGRHPWPEEWLKKAAPLDCLWHFEIAARPEELWPIVSDTSRMNRAMGVSRMQFTEKDGVLQGSSVNAGFEQRWVEVPWRWVAERGLESTRVYERGFAFVGRGIFEMAMIGEERTRFDVYFGWVPRGLVSRALLRIGMSSLKRQFGRVLGEIEADARAGRPVLAPVRESRMPISPDGAARLESLATRLTSQGTAVDVVRKLVDFIKMAEDGELYRVQILPLARRWQLDADALLSACLRATRVGLLELSWDVICPHCRGVRTEARMLGEIPAKDTCEPCGIDFSTNGNNAVEITFRVHPSIREVERVFYCSAEPAFKKHIQVQQVVGPGSELTLETALRPGSYRLRVGAETDAATLEVGGVSDAREIRWRASQAKDDVRAAPEPTLVLVNDTDAPLAFVVEGRNWADEALRPDRLLNFSEFRDLYSEAYIGSDVQLSVGKQTVLFTDVVGSTALYASRGDPGTFVDVKRHFTEIYAVIRECRGVVVKTVGDAVMAAFAEPVDALRASRGIHQCFPPGRADLAIRVRVSLNTGPCIAVNLNTGMDFFGNTVNVAAKLQAFAGAGQTSFSGTTLDQPDVRAYLDGEKAVLVEARYRVPGAANDMLVLRWDVNP